MIFRLSQKLNARIKAGVLATVPLDENPLADWSAGLFLVGRSPYILLSNTKSLYSTVLPAQGVTSETAFIEHASRSIREFMEAEGQIDVWERFVAPVSGSVRYAKALNRSVTGSMNELVADASWCLAERDLSPHEVGVRLNDVLLWALAWSTSFSYGMPREAFKALVESARGERPPLDS